MAKLTVDTRDISPQMLENLEKYGLIEVRSGDIIERVILDVRALSSSTGTNGTDHCLSWVRDIKPVNIDGDKSPFVHTQDFGPKGYFATGGELAVEFNEVTGVALMPRVNSNVFGNSLFARLSRNVGHVETKEEYLKFKSELLGEESV